jgi:signal transduction histidine kinase
MREADTHITKTAVDFQSPIGSVDLRMVSLMRLLLALSALTVTYIDPTQPDRFVWVTYASLILYCIYSGILYILSIYREEWLPIEISHWIDVGCYLVFVGLSYGTGSIFFFFFFFPILFTAFHWGFKTALRVSIVSAALFTIIGYLASPGGEDFEINRFIIRPIYLLVLGYMIAYWGEREITFKKRLSLLKHVSSLSNPRFGVDQTLSSIMNQVRAFYDADTFILITVNPESSSFLWREATRDDPYKSLKAERTAAAAPLINPLGESAVFYECLSSYFQGSPQIYYYDVLKGEKIEDANLDLQALIDNLGASSFITVPLHQRGALIGRIFLTSDQKCFVRTDIEFLLQLMDHILPAIENVELLDRLASEAAEQQRQKISRDIHDSTIQPYIGLKLGLEALELKNEVGTPIKGDIQKLIRLADSSINDLRSYIRNLRGESKDKPGAVLITAVKHQANKFQEFYGIKVDVEAAEGFRLNDRLSAEAFQIITEGLSNIKRHTNATSTTIRIYLKSSNLYLEIENVHEKENHSQEFIPKSIFGRAEALGGTTKIEQLNGNTKVVVAIPL